MSSEILRQQLSDEQQKKVLADRVRVDVTIIEPHLWCCICDECNPDRHHDERF